jgi:hypoxanthine phosphoribosyltransferase
MIIGRPLFTVEQIQARIADLGNRISNDYAGREILAIGVLKGAFMFYSDLARSIRLPLTADFIISSSYVSTTTTGDVKVYYDVREQVKGKHVLLIEDIVDTGISLNYHREKILQAKPESLKICAFLDKRERRIVDVPLDYVGFEIPNVFVVGYGLDYENQFRNLPYISIFKKKA